MLVIGQDTYASLGDLEAIAIQYGDSRWLETTEDSLLDSYARAAALYLDNAWHWLGSRSVPGQPMAWPRTGCVDRDGSQISPDVVPECIVMAQALLFVARNAGPLDGGTGGSGADRVVLRESADDASVEYERGSAQRRYPPVSAMIGHLTIGNRIGSFRQAPGIRG
jgi:hypothetical protein